MGHVGDIGRGGGRRGHSPMPTGEGPLTGSPEGLPAGTEAGPTPEGRGRTGERPVLRTGERPALGTGERPASRTGERPVLRTGERPALGTGERPALTERGPSRTGSRPALPSATFADALTPNREGKLSKGAETLVMPKVELPADSSKMTRAGKTREMPALKDGKAAAPDSSPEPREGRSVSDMDTPIGRGGGTRIVRMPEASGGRTRPEGTEGGKGPRPDKGTEARPAGRDGFGTTPATGNRPALGTGPVKGPVLPVEELIPPGLGELEGGEEVATRFASDGALLHQQIRPSDLPSTDRAVRLWAFFTAYAEAAVGKEQGPEGKEIFDKALKEQGFGEYRDARTGNDGAKAARWVLESSSPEQARNRADEVDFEPPPEVLVSESVQHQESARKAESAPHPEAHRKPEENAHRSEHRAVDLQGIERAPLERLAGQPDFVRVNPQLAEQPRPVILPPNPEQLRRQEEEAPPGSRLDDVLKKFRGVRLGGNMLWNVLHRSRNGPEDSSIEKEKWNQLVFAAILAFVGLMLIIIVVVAL